MKKIKNCLIFGLLLITCFLSGCETETVDNTIIVTTAVEQNIESDVLDESFSLANLPAYNGNPYVIINDNQPFFTEADLTTEPFEVYSELDELGRCQVAYANICLDLMPTEKRGNISQVKPTGWQSVKYDCVDGKYLYNRCHLIGFQLAGENANEKNLITGTRYLNVDGMLPFENMVADYVEETENHVLYRVTPIFNGSDLVAKGVLMEAESVEDSGEEILFNVFVYNVQPGISIDYATGNSWISNEEQEKNENKPTAGNTYILNISSMKFHDLSCESASKMNESNKEVFSGSRDDLIDNGYSPCGICKP